MHKYTIKLTRYTEAGAPTSDTRYEYADTPQQVADKCKTYNAMRYTSVDEEGQTITGYKMYKVEPMQAEYKPIEDYEAFCEVNKVLV